MYDFCVYVLVWTIFMLLILIVERYITQAGQVALTVWLSPSIFFNTAHGHCSILLLVCISQTLISLSDAAADSFPACSCPLLLPNPLPHGFSFPLLQAPYFFSFFHLPCGSSSYFHCSPKAVNPPPAAAPSVWASAEPKVLLNWATQLPPESLCVSQSFQAQQKGSNENPCWGLWTNAKTEQHRTLSSITPEKPTGYTAFEDAD